MKFVYSKRFYNEMNRTVAFRAILPKGHFAVSVAAANVYRVWLNDRMITYGPMRAAHGFCNVLHLNFATDEKNYLTVEIAGYNINSYYFAMGKPFFGIEIFDEKNNLIMTCDDFICYHLADRVQKMNRYSMQRFFAEAYSETYPRQAFYLGADIFPQEQTIEVSGAILAECDVSKPKYETLDPIEISDIGRYFIDQNKQSRNIEWFYPQKLFATMGFEREELDVDLYCEVDKITAAVGGNGRGEIYRFPYNATGFLAFDYDAESDSDIFVTFDELPFESPFRNSSLNAVKLSVKKGRGKFLSFEPYTMQYAKAFVFGNTKISKFHIVEYKNPDVQHFDKLPNENLDKVFRAAIRTFEQNAVDILTDCPSRERAGWLCDSYFTSKAEKLFTGDNKVERNTLRAFLNAPEPFVPLPEGMIPMCYPSNHDNGNFIANWSLWLILELKDYLLRSGDRKLIDDFKRKIYKLLDFFRKYENEDGLIENMDGWVFIEWSKANEFVGGVNYPSNMLYAGALNAVAEMYADNTAKEKAQKIKNVIRKQSFNGTFFVDNVLRTGGKLIATNNTTETCQYYAFYFDIATKSSHPELFDIMFNNDRKSIEKQNPTLYPSNAFIGYMLRLDYLAKQGRIRQVIDECGEYFLYMAERTGTLWEHRSTEASCNHGFASVVGVWIAMYYNLLKNRGKNNVA